MNLMPLRYPKNVLIDLCTTCHARCFYCLHQRKHMVEPSMICYEDFKEIINILAQDKVKLVHLYQSGEPFLHPFIHEFIAYSAGAGLNTSTATKLCTHIDYEAIEYALDFTQSAKKKAEFVFTVDSLNQDTMSRIAPGIKVELVKTNLRQMAEIKRKHQSLSIRVSTIVNKLNEPELPEIKQFMSELGLKWAPEGFGYYMADYADSSDIQLVQSMIPLDKKYQRVTSKKTKCPYPMIPVIDVHGELSICCHDMLHVTKLGNVMEAGSLRKVVDSEPFQAAYKASLKRELKICGSCN